MFCGGMEGGTFKGMFCGGTEGGTPGGIFCGGMEGGTFKGMFCGGTEGGIFKGISGAFKGKGSPAFCFLMNLLFLFENIYIYYLNNIVNNIYTNEYSR
jgi:hypothetical protein